MTSESALTLSAQLTPYLTALASRQPVPGGGAAAAVTLAQAAALGAMVLEYTIGKPKFSQHESRNRAALAFLRGCAFESLELADRDAAAYANLEVFLRLDAPSRAAAPQFAPALAEAIAAPQAIGDLAAAVADATNSLTATTSRMLRSDLACACELARAATICAGWNVRANLPLVADETLRASLLAWIQAREGEASSACQRVAKACL
ncbi:MAG: hypothetical protein EXS00_03265 [Phycisphaerales bacterium]|nr:hypothetical protein [Phycisphaerales bacterium]